MSIDTISQNFTLINILNLQLPPLPIDYLLKLQYVSVHEQLYVFPL